MHMYILYIGFNTTSHFGSIFYFVYYPKLPHLQLLGGILNIELKFNSGAGTEKIFLSHFPGHGLFLLPLKKLDEITIIDTEPETFSVR